MVGQMERKTHAGDRPVRQMMPESRRPAAPGKMQDEPRQMTERAFLLPGPPLSVLVHHATKIKKTIAITTTPAEMASA